MKTKIYTNLNLLGIGFMALSGIFHLCPADHYYSNDGLKLELPGKTPEPGCLKHG